MHDAPGSRCVCLAYARLWLGPQHHLLLKEDSCNAATFVYFFLYLFTQRGHIHATCMCGNKRLTCRTQFSSSNLWAMGIGFSSLGLVADIIYPRAILPVHTYIHTYIFFKMLYYFFVCMCVYMCWYIPPCACRDQRTICRSWFFPSTTWLPRIDLRFVKLGSKHLLLARPLNQFE